MAAFPARGQDHDVAILGGGLSGLSLAVRLAERAPRLRVAVIEPRTTYVRDRTWCCWRLHGHPFEDAVEARWTRWSVTDRAGRVVTRGSEALPYEMIPSDRLYASALARLRQAPNVTLRLGCRAERLAEHPGHVGVETSEGLVTADLVFDSRPPRAAPDALAQRFLGQEIETDRPAFDPGRVTLMDFAVAQIPGAVRFLYVLPVTPTRALVEDTWFAPADLALPDHRDAIRRYLAERHGIRDYRVAFEEEGAIPMDAGLQAPASAGRILPLGAAGGAVKPSSGYAFLAIQRMADALADDLAAGRRPAPPQPRDGRARWMDAVFLEAIRRRPAAAPALFASLFRGCRPEPLIRFLGDRAGMADVAEVIAATPKLAMVAAAARLRFRP